TSIGAVFAASLVQVPAIWLIVGATGALIGAAPRASYLGWPIIAATFVISFFGPLLKLPHIVLDLSAFTHVPHLPGGSIDAVPMITLGVVAAALIAVGMV